MYASFSGKLDETPYTAIPAKVDLNEVNKPNAFGAAQSMKMDFSKEDAADDLILGDIVWRSVRGADSPMPAPVRAAFVFTRGEEEEEDEEHEAEEKDDDDEKEEEEEKREQAASGKLDKDQSK
jgi:dihydrofolate reductase